jgi:hypothetical protein
MADIAKVAGPLLFHSNRSLNHGVRMDPVDPPIKLDQASRIASW